MEMYSDEMLQNYILKRRHEIGEEFSEILLKYISWMKRRGNRGRTRYSHLETAYRFLKFLKQHSISLSDVNQQIIDDFIDSVSLKVHQNTVRRIIIALRNFLKFLDERMGIHVHYTLPIPKEIKRIPVVLSEEEIINIVLSIDNPKFQLLFALYYETGARRTELLSVKLKHIRLHENYAEIAIPQSKSIPRVVPVVLFYPLLARFLETHPGKDNLEAYLFYSNRNYLRPMSQTTVWNFFDEISHKYGKRITPHVLRHSRGTHLAKMGMMEKEIMIILGQSTRRMIDVYVHLAGRDARAKLLSLYGVGEDEKITPIKCPRCNHTNPSGAQYCIRCGHPLNIKAAKEHYEAQRKLELILRKLENVPLEKIKGLLD